MPHIVVVYLYLMWKVLLYESTVLCIIIGKSVKWGVITGERFYVWPTGGFVYSVVSIIVDYQG